MRVYITRRECRWRVIFADMNGAEYVFNLGCRCRCGPINCRGCGIAYKCTKKVL